jgi:hypothetical protein
VLLLPKGAEIAGAEEDDDLVIILFAMQRIV